jgi:hypothetical protein
MMDWTCNMNEGDKYTCNIDRTLATWKTKEMKREYKEGAYGNGV